MDSILCRNLKEHVYKVPTRTIEDLMAGLQAAMAKVDANM
jgi:hypothetical protein